MIEGELHTATGSRDNHFPFKNRITKLERSLPTIAVLSESYAFNQNDIADDVGFFCHSEFQTELLHWVSM